eukprot:2134706-Amphidinium_carterae.1
MKWNSAGAPYEFRLQISRPACWQQGFELASQLVSPHVTTSVGPFLWGLGGAFPLPFHPR